jgi:hypothetical protein
LLFVTKEESLKIRVCVHSIQISEVARATAATSEVTKGGQHGEVGVSLTLLDFINSLSISRTLRDALSPPPSSSNSREEAAFIISSFAS